MRAFHLLSIFLINTICLLAQPHIYVDPANQIVYGQKTVTVNFRITNAVNIRTYGVTIVFDTSVIKFKSATKGPFLASNGTFGTTFLVTPTGSYVKNTINIAESILGPGVGANGSWLMFSIDFNVISFGVSPISITSVTLYDLVGLVPKTFTSGFVTIAGKVLLVDDDAMINKNLESTLGASANLFKSALTSVGYFVEQVNFSTLNTSTLSNYDVIILSAGVKESSIFNDVNKRTALINYTLAGGKTLVEGGDVGNLFSVNNYGDPDHEFRRNLLLDSTWSSDRIGANLQITNSNHPIFRIPNNISSPSTISINNGGSSGSGARDEMSLLTKTGISRIANWIGGAPENGGIILYNTDGDTAKCRNVFYTFSVANLTDQTLASKLIVNTANYLMRDVESPFKLLNLRALIEGFFNGSKLVQDSISVELRESSAPFTLKETKRVKLDTLGYATLIYQSIEQTKPYYLVLKHRNSIETWSAVPYKFTSGFLNYDFTNGQTKAYGNNLKQINNKWCIYSGDVNQDGIVDLTDVSLTDADNLNFIAGYVVTDLNGDNIVDISDLSLVDNNNLIFVSKITPAFSRKIK